MEKGEVALSTFLKAFAIQHTTLGCPVLHPPLQLSQNLPITVRIDAVI